MTSKSVDCGLEHVHRMSSDAQDYDKPSINVKDDESDLTETDNESGDAATIVTVGRMHAYDCVTSAARWPADHSQYGQDSCK